MDLIFENKSVKFYFNNETKIFKASFFGVVNIQLITEAFEFIISNPSDLGTKAVITDLTKLKGTFTMLMDYFEDNLYPYLNSKGIICDAIVLNKDIFTKFSVKKLENAIDYIQIKTFTDEDEALAWIKLLLEK